jgi:hypothetical protein
LLRSEETIVRHSFRALLVLLMTFLLAGVSALAEDILLKDGTKITGKIIGVKDDTFQVKTSYGDIQIPRAEIISISFPENQPKEGAEAVPEVDESLVGTTYTNRTGKFQMTLPAGWKLFPEIRKESKDIIAAITSPDGMIILMVTPESFSGTFNSYKALVELNLKGSFGEYKRLSEAEVTVDGRTAVKWVWTGLNKQANNAPMKSALLILPYEGKYVRVAFITLEPLFDDAVPAIDKIFASYKSLQR